MTTNYDAIIIGAGPAGSTAASELARRGHSVLLLEAKTLPRDKPCGGALTPRAWRQLSVPIDDLVLARATSVGLRVGERFSARIRSREAAIWMVRRRDLDLRLAEEAARCGAVLHDGEPVHHLLQHHGAVRPGHRDDLVSVETGHGSYTGRVLVGADGAESRVARWLGLARPSRWMVALEAEIEAAGDPPGGEAVVDLDVPHGYAWAFPRGGAWSVGVGTFSPAHSRQLRPLLTRFLSTLPSPQSPVLSPQFRIQHPAPSTPHQPSPLHPSGRRIPTGLTSGPLHSGCALLVGDAAGVADPFFAEGISYSLLSGRMAAEVASSYLCGDASDLSAYTRRLRAALLPDMRLWRLTAAVVHRFPEPSVRLLAALPPLQSLLERTIAGEVRIRK